MHHDFAYWSNRAEREAIRAINAASRVAAGAHDEIVLSYARKAAAIRVPRSM